MKRLKNFYKSKWFWIILIIIAILSLMIAYHTSWKSLPGGISYEGDTHEMENIEFFRDLTFENEAGEVEHDLQIFEEINKTIAEADDFIVADMFLFNGYHSGKHDFPPISSDLVDAILERKEEVPDLKVVFITDQINTIYGSYQSETIKRLEDGGVEVVLTNLNKLRDSNPLYSSVWRSFFSWMGTGEGGWIGNPLSKEAPEVTLRSYMKLLNIKANHRKLLVTENSAIVSTANPHDASGFHENVAFKMEGPIIKDILEAEEAVVDYSGGAEGFPDYENRTWKEQEGSLATRFVTEGKIYKAVLDELSQADEGDDVWLGMYYLADKKVMSSLDDAANRGATVNIIMDPNKTAFGHEKTGIPNLPVAAELQRLGNENIHLRWYDVHMEQYHTKMLYIDKSEENVIVAGSANYTRRNLANLNLEADVVIKGTGDEEVFTEVKDYFQRIWNNEEGRYTADYEEYQDKLTFIRYATYYLQKWTWFTTY
jgi:cardiolipin synthase A/B